ncbi:MAG TPA: hypothetical protein VHV77_15970 [Pirellulales bacterium]|nr:hypothetical protein [Pirellulales bacterium]
MGYLAMHRVSMVYIALLLLVTAAVNATEAASLSIAWDKKYLTISGPSVPGDSVRVHYLEAYCRPGSTDRDWKETVIPHESQLLEASPANDYLKLQDTLADGVTVTHEIRAFETEITFDLVAYNPTATASDVAWAQPCIRLDKFTGHAQDDYLPYCFVFIDGKLTPLPTTPWATMARYVPGQVYCPHNVDRNDVNPRPLSTLVPSCGLCGTFSGDRKWILAAAWEPYQELFQGVRVCMHSDFRIGGLAPGETKNIRGKIYLMPAVLPDLMTRYDRDFPSQAAGNAGLTETPVAK